MPSQLFLLFVLFFLLAKAADIIIVGIREISEKLKVNLYVAGIMLGFFTSLPEMSIAWSALASRAVSVSSDNLYGGIIVLFGFILGLSLVANIRELSISNLLGSAITNGLIFGATAFVMPTSIAQDAQYAVTGVAIIGILAVVTLAYHSHKNFSRTEGYALLLCYIAFLLASYLVS